MDIIGIQGTYLSVIKATYHKATANTIVSRENLKSFPLKLETKQRCSPSPSLFNTVLEALAREIRQMREIQGIEIGKEDTKVFLLLEDRILFRLQKKTPRS